MSCKFVRRALAIAILAFALPTAPAQAERDMFIVGSTFLAPYVETVVGALVGRKVINPPRTAFGGTGAGVAQFCASAALTAPDVVAMSRRMRAAELETCMENGVGGVIEIKLGLNALVLVARRDDADLGMSLDAFYRAVAAELPRDTEFLPNAYSNWNEVHGTLPRLPIRVMVPAPGLGSRGFFEDRFLQSACRDVFEIKTIVVAVERVEQCIGLRKDGRIGEISIPYDVNLRKTMQEAPPGTVAIAPLNMAKEMLDVVKVLAFDGVAPTQENIASRTYQFVRPLYVYVKRANVKNYAGVGPVSGLREFITELTRERTIGPNGYLVKEGLEPLSTDRRDAVRRSALNLTPMER